MLSMSRTDGPTADSKTCEPTRSPTSGCPVTSLAARKSAILAS